MTELTLVSSLGGGLLIGGGAALLLVSHRKIAGISGIIGGLLSAKGDRDWRIAFLVGLVCVGLTLSLFFPEAYVVEIERSSIAFVVAGLLVGVGTRIGNGCTSGHGVCGISRFSKRSLLATLVFMASGALTVFLINHVLGGDI